MPSSPWPVRLKNKSANLGELMETAKIEGKELFLSWKGLFKRTPSRLLV
jgi:hypothetical protein